MILNVLSQACARRIDELRQRRARRGRVRVGELAEDVVGFVEENQTLCSSHADHGAWVERLSARLAGRLVDTMK
jgi:hypothetical protein